MSKNVSDNTETTNPSNIPSVYKSDDNRFPQPDNFTEPEAARWLKVSRITLQRTRLRGEIAYARIGGCRVIYTRKHLEDYIASRERAAFNPIRTRQTSFKTA